MMPELFLYVHPAVWVVLGLLLLFDIFVEYSNYGVWSLFMTAYAAFASLTLVGGLAIWVLW